MKKLLLSLSTALAVGFAATAQTAQLFTEDFQAGGSAFTLNSSGPGTSSGHNNWIVTNNYSGVPTYPNTMSQDSTYGGAIAFAPHGQYLHIHDFVSGITNANYDPTSASDNFAYLTSGICTLGMDSIHLNFFYLCQGSATAFGMVYYSVNGGAWIQTGAAQYNNTYKWKYEVLSNPAFANKLNVRFGFRWINNAGAPVNSESFSIDDVVIVGYYSATTATITVDSVTPNPICSGNYLFIHWHLSDTLCDGSYVIELSTPTGGFPTASLWAFTIYYPQTSGVTPIAIPLSTPIGSCYKMRISRGSPAPVITGIASACFTINNCPNTINTLQPAITMDTNAVCTGSAIDVPFYSTGLFTSNTYTAELSDSNGVFPATPTVVGSSFNSIAYDQSLGSPPGNVPGMIPNVPPGCGYYIRVVSSGPAASGVQWGPFCIRQCDIQTTNNADLHFCVTDCSANPAGADTTIQVGVNSFDTIAHYLPGNIFETQLLNMTTLAQIGANGIIGSVAAAGDTALYIHIPCHDSMPVYGVPVGTYYMRVIATNSSQPDNALGSLVRVTVGSPGATAEVITMLNYATFVAQDSFCLGDMGYLLFSPYNYSDNSTYMWQCPSINGGLPFVSPSGANSNTLLINFGGVGTLPFKVQETSYGCVGPWSALATAVVSGPPNVTITGPSSICAGDTAHYQVPYLTNTYYSWSAPGTFFLHDTINMADLSYSSAGTHSLNISAINQCGTATNTKTISVHALPAIPIISQAGSVLISSATTGNQWYRNDTLIAGATSQNYTFSIIASYSVTVTNTYGCSATSLPFILGVNELNNSLEISVSPNPFINEISICFSEEQRNTTLKIMNVLGECVNDVQMRQCANVQMNLSDLKKGIYFVEIQTGKGMVRQKLVKE